jgi:hypothetical protein
MQWNYKAGAMKADGALRAAYVMHFDAVRASLETAARSIIGTLE